MKIAIACSGLDHVRRGFETFAEELFQQLRSREEFDAVLFKGSGRTSTSEEVLWSVSRDSTLWGGWKSPISWERRYFAEQVTFALSLQRRLRRKPVDVLLFCDIQIGIVLRHFWRISDAPVLLFSNSGQFHPRDYKEFDSIQQPTPSFYDQALTYGISREKMVLLPYGVDTEFFAPNSLGGRAFRRSLEIGADEKVVLSVGVRDSRIKRMDWLIKEISAMDDPPHLVLCGEYKAGETTAIDELGRNLLGSRFHAVRLGYGEMPAAYNAANVFALCSLKEGFGRVFLESLACGVPVVHHADEDMSWIVGRGGVEVDMTINNRLASVLGVALQDENYRFEMSREARLQAQGFSWKSLVPRYAEMFRQACLRSNA